MDFTILFPFYGAYVANPVTTDLRRTIISRDNGIYRARPHVATERLTLCFYHWIEVRSVVIDTPRTVQPSATVVTPVKHRPVTLGFVSIRDVGTLNPFGTPPRG